MHLPHPFFVHTIIIVRLFVFVMKVSFFLSRVLFHVPPLFAQGRHFLGIIFISKQTAFQLKFKSASWGGEQGKLKEKKQSRPFIPSSARHLGF